MQMQLLYRGDTAMANKVIQVFTKEYKQETEYIDLLRKAHQSLKLETRENESIDGRVKRLSSCNFVSNFTISESIAL